MPEYALACATVIPLLNQPRLFVVLKNSQKARNCEDDEKNNKPHHRLTHAHSSSNLTSKSIINRLRPIVNGFLIFAAIFRKSNSRSRKGCDRFRSAYFLLQFSFNSRTRKGCDLIGTSKTPSSSSFNSRTRKGCDIVRYSSYIPSQVSIHAPVKGATSPVKQAPERVGVSIHAPVKGATKSETKSGYQKAVSIHAPVKGATAQNAVIFERPLVSIHAPVKGATAFFCLGLGDGGFNSRTRKGCDLFV